MFKQKYHLMCDNVRENINITPSQELRGLAYLDKPNGMHGPIQVHLQGVQVVPSCGIRGVFKPFPFNEVEQTQPIAVAVNFAVKDPIYLPLIRVIQLDQWLQVNHSVGNLTRAGWLVAIVKCGRQDGCVTELGTD